MQTVHKYQLYVCNLVSTWRPQTEDDTKEHHNVAARRKRVGMENPLLVDDCTSIWLRGNQRRIGFQYPYSSQCVPNHQLPETATVNKCKWYALRDKGIVIV